MVLTEEQKARKRAYNREYQKTYRVLNKDRIRENRLPHSEWSEERKAKHRLHNQKRWERIKENPEEKLRRRNYAFKVDYGISVEEYNIFLEKQNYVCAICSKKHEETQYGRLAVDHCHETGRVRGLICRRCNHGLGNFKDNLASMYNAIAYLRRSMS